MVYWTLIEFPIVVTLYNNCFEVIADNILVGSYLVHQQYITSSLFYQNIIKQIKGTCQRPLKVLAQNNNCKFKNLKYCSTDLELGNIFVCLFLRSILGCLLKSITTKIQTNKVQINNAFIESVQLKHMILQHIVYQQNQSVFNAKFVLFKVI